MTQFAWCSAWWCKSVSWSLLLLMRFLWSPFSPFDILWRPWWRWGTRRRTLWAARSGLDPLRSPSVSIISWGSVQLYNCVCVCVGGVCVGVGVYVCLCVCGSWILASCHLHRDISGWSILHMLDVFLNVFYIHWMCFMYTGTPDERPPCF